MEKDIFGFADAIQLDHLNLEQLKELEKLLDKIKQKAARAPEVGRVVYGVRLITLYESHILRHYGVSC